MSKSRRFKWKGKTSGFIKTDAEARQKEESFIKPGPIGIIEIIPRDCQLPGRNRRVAAGYFEYLVSINEKLIYWSFEHPLEVYYLGTGVFTHVEPSSQSRDPMKLPPECFFKRYDNYEQFSQKVWAEAESALGPKLNYDHYQSELENFLKASKEIFKIKPKFVSL
jgi:hypothetical protein